MCHWKTSLASLIILGGLGGSASAQQGNAPDRGYSTFPGAGTNGDYYSISANFGPYGLPGGYPKYQGYGFSGYGPGAIVNEYFVPWPGPGVRPAVGTKPAPGAAIGPRSIPKSTTKGQTASKAVPSTRKPMGR